MNASTPGRVQEVDPPLVVTFGPDHYNAAMTSPSITLSSVILLTGYAARPIGGLSFGHFGDKVGRNRMLFITLMVMGLVSIGIGVPPSSATIGAAATTSWTVRPPTTSRST